MEQKGIKTERGNINRRIIAINNDLRNSLREIAEVGRWIGRITRAVISAFKELSDEKEQESKFEPQLFDLYTYLKTYDKMQNEIALTFDSKNKARKRNSDSKKSFNTLVYMHNNKLNTIIDFQIKKDEVNKNLKDNKAEINDINDRLKTLETLFKQAEIIKQNTKVYSKYKNMDNSIMSKLKSQSKDVYYKKHKTEIDKFKRAMSVIINLNGDLEKNITTEVKNWEKEREKLKSNLSILEFNQKEIKAEVSQLKHIIYMVDKVNDEYGIEIDIKFEQEYFKALAKGKEPTPMENMRHNQRQIKLEEKQREKNREYYQNKSKTKGDMER